MHGTYRTVEIYNKKKNWNLMDFSGSYGCSPLIAANHFLKCIIGNLTNTVKPLKSGHLNFAKIFSHTNEPLESGE